MSAAAPIAPRAARVSVPVLAVVAGGVAAALHVGKLPPALPALQSQLQVSLVQAGFLLSLVQLAGMALGVLAGLAADNLGLRRSMVAGLLLLSIASAAGSLASVTSHPVAWLLSWRAVEGLGFLLAVMPGPGLVRRLAPVSNDKAAMGLWGAYMPLGVALALLLGPWVIGAGGWPAWWQGLAGAALLATVAVWRTVPCDPRSAAPIQRSLQTWSARLVATVRAPGPWLLATAFGAYSAQWMAVIGFLPTICAQAGLDVAVTAWLAALAAALNIVGNVGGGRLLQRGWAPVRLLRWGFVGMALTSLAAFVPFGGALDESGGSALARYVAICSFSLSGGAVPATLFMLAVRIAPTPSTISTTVGLMQQASSFGQFVAPPAVAWLAYRAGGWQWTWACTMGCSLAGIAAVGALSRARRRDA